MTNKKEYQIPGKLIPALREAVELVKLILFKRISSQLSKDFADKTPAFSKRLTGALINKIFAMDNPDAVFQEFCQNNELIIAARIAKLPAQYSELLIPLSDALRIQFMCDCQDGTEDANFLERAKDLGLLLLERDMPMPGSFLNMVGKLAMADGLVTGGDGR